MTTSARILFVLLIAGLTAAGWQRTSLNAARRQHASLTGLKDEADRGITEHLGSVDPQQVAVSAQTNDPTIELLQLRNKVRQLRLVPEEAERLRTENARLSAHSTPDPHGAKLSEQEGYLAKPDWAEAGLTTPEAALQTFFRALRDEDTPRLISTLSEQGGRALGIRTNATGELRPEALEAIRALGRISGFRIEESQPMEDGRVVLGLRAVEGGAKLRLKFRRDGEGWKIDSQ
jgi:hypothetical protein